MNDIPNIVDAPYVSDERIVLTTPQLHIPGIRTFATHKLHTPHHPLDLHYHKNAFEFTLITEGSLTFSTETSSYRFRGGDVFISYPNEIHGTDGHPLSGGEYYWFQMDICDCRGLLFLDDESAENLVNRLNSIKHHVVSAQNKELSNHMKTAFQLALTHEDPHLIAAYLLLFLNLLIYTAERPKFNLTSDISNSMNYIMDHLYEHITLDALSSQASLSDSQFKRKFKAQMGISPRNFINQMKIEAAKVLLSDGVSITDTAMQLGFDTSSYFSVVFRKYTAMSPSEFVKQI